MRILAGILTIIGGLVGGSLLVGILHGMHIYGVLLYLPVFLAWMGAYYALKRKRWKWALVGAICSCLFPFTGIPAVILLIRSKGEFQG
jgi:hypothetical protein